MPRKTLTDEQRNQRKENMKQYYQKNKDWVCAYAYARRTGEDIYEVCRQRGIEVPDSYEKKKTTYRPIQSREEILAINAEYRRKKVGAIRTIQAFFRRFIARKKKKEA